MDVDEESVSKEITKVQPKLVIGILSVTLTALEDQPEGSSCGEIETLYLTIKQFLWTLTKKTHNKDLTSAIFAYYIEAYRALQYYKEFQVLVDFEDVSVRKVTLYNEAALSLFDLYLLRSSDPIVRRLLQLSAEALQQIVITHQSANEDAKAVDIISELSTVALLSQTLKDYVKGQGRHRNFSYIKWLRAFYQKILSTLDLSFIKEDSIVLDVVKQVSSSKKIIDVLI